MDKEFLTGYLSIADGEKDPRNLLVAFAIARVILIEFDGSSNIEVNILGLVVSQGAHSPVTVIFQHNILLFPYHLPTAA